MKRVLVSLCLLTLAGALPVCAQTEHNTIARIVEVTTKSGMSQQFEAGLKKYHQWEKEHKAPATYFAWVVISGDRYGHYFLGTFGHDWKDFDEFEKNSPAGSGEQLRADVAPYVENVKISYMNFRKDISLAKPDPTKPPSRFTELITFMLKPGGGQDVTGAIKDANAAEVKSNWTGTPSQWYSLVNGGEGNQLILALNRNDWADFQPPEKSLGDVLADVYGKEGAQAIGHKFNKQITTVRSEILRYLPDLSYIAGSM